MISAGFRVLLLGALSIVFFGALIFQANAQTAGPGPGPGPGAGHAPASTSVGKGGAAPPAGAGPDGTSAVKSVTRSAERAISTCPDDSNSERCIADALDAYADALRNLSPSLPPDLQELPDIVSRAAREVRQAKTKAQAVKAVKIAIAEVHKTISLLKADDPVVLKVETREGAFVAETLEVADNKLEKAVGL
jgi:hypothetical protein